MSGTVLGSRIEARLAALRMTKGDLSRALNVSRTRVSNWFARGSIPEPRILGQIAEILDTTTDYLFGNTENPNRPPPEGKAAAAADESSVDQTGPGQKSEPALAPLELPPDMPPDLAQELSGVADNPSAPATRADVIVVARAVEFQRQTFVAAVEDQRRAYNDKIEAQNQILERLTTAIERNNERESRMETLLAELVRRQGEDEQDAATA